MSTGRGEIARHEWSIVAESATMLLGHHLQLLAFQPWLCWGRLR